MGFNPSNHACGWIPRLTNSFVEKCYKGTDGDASLAAACTNYRFTTSNTAADLAMIQSKISLPYASTATC